MKALKFSEPYSCERDCKTATGWDTAKRAGRGCSRPDLPPVEWDVSAAVLYAPRTGMGSTSIYMGRAPDKALTGTVDLAPISAALPTERSAEGCPGGWYRTPYASSVLRYARRRTEGGGRVENGLLRDVDALVWMAVNEYEREQARADADEAGHARACAEKARKAADKGAKPNGRRR